MILYNISVHLRIFIYTIYSVNHIYFQTPAPLLLSPPPDPAATTTENKYTVDSRYLEVKGTL